MDTIETFKPVYQRFLESGMTVREFCKSSGLTESHFYYWQSRFRKEAARQSGSFVPVSINNRGGNKIVLNGQHQVSRSSMAHPMLEISYPNGVTLRISEALPPAVLRELILMER